MNDLTTDPFPGDFPPASYGTTLAEVEATISQVIERIFRDEDGILRSAVNGLTMKILSPEDVKDRPNGYGTYAENSDIPREFKAIWTNFENAGQASGTYLEALCHKYRATGDETTRPLAQRTVQAIITVWENAAHIKHPLGGEGRGWLPKPYAGIRNVAGMHECSIDQYCDVTLGLHTYYKTFATAAEKRTIEDIIVSFADWWNDHDYCGVYFGKAIYWKRLPWHPMAVAAFLYINALADSFKPCRKYQQGFDLWMEKKEVLESPDTLAWSCMHGIPLNCLERLMALRPELAEFWNKAVVCQSAGVIKSMEDTSGGFRQFNQNAYGAHYLSTAHRVIPSAGYDKRARQCLEACMRREVFYHIKRGLRVADLDSKLTGDDYRNMFMAETHAHWLTGYWAGLGKG